MSEPWNHYADLAFYAGIILWIIPICRLLIKWAYDTIMNRDTEVGEYWMLFAYVGIACFILTLVLVAIGDFFEKYQIVPR